MKNCTKKLVSLVLVAAMSLAISVSGFAEKNTNVLKDSGVKDSSAISYISESDAILLADQLIKEEVETADHCCWTKSTKISETVDLFDLEGNVNAYLFRLTTNGKRTGYVFVNAYAKAPSVDAFGYNGDFILDSWQEANGKNRASTSNHIIFAGGLSFLNQGKTSEKYFVIGDVYNKINANKSDLINNYKNNLLSKVNMDAQNNLKSLKTNRSNGFARASGSTHHDLPGIFSSGYQIYITSDFHTFNNCTPTAATNLVYYWSHYGNPKQPQLWKGRVHDDLATYMNFETDRGVFQYDILPGIEKFAISRNDPISQSSEEGNHWNSIINDLDEDYPVMVTIAGDPNYGGKDYGHTMLAVGYRENPKNQYIRVADGWKRTFDNFYKFSDYITNGFVVSW